MFLRSLPARGVCDRAVDLLLVWQVRQRLAGPRAQQGGLAGSPQVASPDAKPWSPGPERTDLEPFSGIPCPESPESQEGVGKSPGATTRAGEATRDTGQGPPNGKTKQPLPPPKLSPWIHDPSSHSLAEPRPPGPALPL